MEDSSEEEIAEEPEESNEVAGTSDLIPYVIDVGLDTNTRRSSRTSNPPKLLTFKDFQAARN